MGYCTASDVQARCGALFTLTTTSKPSTTQVDSWIEETSARVNAALAAAGYETVPATGANDLLMLKGVVADKVALHALYVALGADAVPSSIVETLAGFRDFIRELRTGDGSLVDQQPQSDADPVFRIVRQPTRDNFFTERYQQDDWDE